MILEIVDPDHQKLDDMAAGTTLDAHPSARLNSLLDLSKLCLHKKIIAQFDVKLVYLSVFSKISTMQAAFYLLASKC